MINEMILMSLQAVKKDPRQAAKLANEAYGSPRSVMATRLPDDVRVV